MICPQCGEERQKGKRGCKNCNRLYQQKWYRRNKEIQKSRVSARKQRIWDELYTYLYDYLATHPCVDCGESDIVVLHFDHREQEEKTDTVSKLIRECKPLEIIQNEVAKCDVRCANCHMRRTAKQLGWKKLMFGDGR